jgi:hypothetical protein
VPSPMLRRIQAPRQLDFRDSLERHRAVQRTRVGYGVMATTSRGRFMLNEGRRGHHCLTPILTPTPANESA